MNIQVDPTSSNLASAMLNSKIRPRAVVGYSVKIFHPSPPNYVTRSPGKSYLEICFSSLLSYMLDNCSLGTKIAEIEKITTRANEFRSHEGITLETSAFQIFKC